MSFVRWRGASLSSTFFSSLVRKNANQFLDRTEILARFEQRKQGLRTFGFALLVGISYYAGTRIGFALTPSQHPIATFWPPNAILLAALLLAPTRMWWAFLLVLLPVHLFVQTQAGVPVWTAVGWFTSNTGEALIGAWCITRYTDGKRVFDSVKGVLLFLAFGVILAPLVTSFLDAAIVVSTGWGSGYWGVGTERFFSNTLAELTLVPTIVVCGSHGVSWIRKATSARYLEASLLVGGILAVSFWVFGSQTAPGNIPALMYAPLPLLLWAAVRFGSGGLSVCLLSMALISIWNAMQGRGPFTTASMEGNVLSLQVLLCMVALPLLFLAALMVERRRAEESLRDISSRLIDAQEKERRRIAHELHDDLGQRLAFLHLKLSGLGESEPMLRPRLSDLVDQLAEVSTTTHELSHGLHPRVLELAGLATAAKRLCADVARGTSVSIRQTVGDLPEPLQPRVSLCLYRVMQEALHNIVVHSRATEAEIILRSEGGRVFLLVVDDGVGFTVGKESPDGLGLASMRERVRSIGGSIDVVSSPMKGTRIEVRVSPGETTPGPMSGAA